MIADHVVELCENLGPLLERPGQLKALRNTVLELAVSGRLLKAADAEEDASTYLAGVLDRTSTSKPAVKLRGVDQPIVPGPIPETWARTMLGLLSTDIRYGTSRKTSESGAVPVLRMGNIQRQTVEYGNLKYLARSDELADLMLRDGDILFNRTNSPALVGKSAVFHGETPFTFASYLIRVRLDEKVDPDFVNLWIGSPAGRAWAQRNKTDAIGQSNINGTNLGRFPLALPPLAEQRTIFARVAAIFKLLDAYETETATLSVLRGMTTASACNSLVRSGNQLLLDHAVDLICGDEEVGQLERSIFGLAVSGRLVPQIRAEGDAQSLVQAFPLTKGGSPDSPDSVADRSGPFEIPRSWVWTTLGVAGDIVGGGTPRSSEPGCFSSDSESGTPWFTPADLGGNDSLYVSRGRRSLTELGLKRSSAQLLPAGAVLFSSRAPIGYVAILEQQGSTNQGFKSFVPNQGVLSEFAYFWLRYWAPEIDAMAPSVTFREVNKKAMERQPIPLPPAAEQARIVERVTELLGLLAALRQRLRAD